VGTPRSSQFQLQTEAEVRGLQRRCRIVPKRRSQENAGFLPPQLWVPQSGPLTEAIASRWRQEPWRPVAEEREQRQATTTMLGELNKLHPDVVKRCEKAKLGRTCSAISAATT
jgi:hypothetical protein